MIRNGSQEYPRAEIEDQYRLLIYLFRLDTIRMLETGRILQSERDSP